VKKRRAEIRTIRPLRLAVAAGLFIFVLGLSAPAAQVSHSVQDLQNEVQRVYRETHAAVANITTRAVTVGMMGMPTTQEGAGSGFLYDRQGHVVTNYHVIKNAKAITVALGDGEAYDARIVGTDRLTDLAVLKIDGNNLPDPLPLSDSDRLEVGEFVVALGNPFSFEQTLTFGVISALGRMIKSPNGSFISEAIQTDAPINPGNSGGPLLDLRGNVIGVNSTIISPSGASAGIGFAISSNIVSKVADALIQKGRYPHPWLGIRPVNLSPSLTRLLERAGLSIPVKQGVLITQLAGGGPADSAGLRGGRQRLRLGTSVLPVGGDIIVGVDDREVDAYKDLLGYLESEISVGEEVELRYYRDGELQRSTVTVGERPQRNTWR
jgi:S1-C subfamily serine protease